MQKRVLIIILFLIVCLGSGYLVAGQINKSNTVAPSARQNAAANSDISAIQSQNNQPPAQDSSQAAQKTQTADAAIYQKIQQSVPFVVQAPFANWKDPIFQNACEEASIIMAMGWVNSTKAISAQDAQDQIKSIVAFENKKFEYNAETDINDMRIIFQDFFHYSNISVRENITLEDIKNEIQKDNIILVPAFGRALGNPNYTAPGPITHMLVIIGYDPTAKKFITNDSGTKHGSGYLYPENTLFEAIWEYPSGAKMPPPPASIRKKGMLVVSKSQ